MNVDSLAKIFSPLIMQALSKTPTLMSNLQHPGSEDMLQNIIEALQNQHDPGIMEDMLTQPRVDTEGNMWPPMQATDVDFHYDTEAHSIDPSSWFFRSLYANNGHGPKIANFEVQGTGLSPESSGFPVSLTNPESENAIEVFSKPQFIDPEERKRNLFNKLMGGSSYGY